MYVIIASKMKLKIQSQTDYFHVAKYIIDKLAYL